MTDCGKYLLSKNQRGCLIFLHLTLFAEKPWRVKQSLLVTVWVVLFLSWKIVVLEKRNLPKILMLVCHEIWKIVVLVKTVVEFLTCVLSAYESTLGTVDFIVPLILPLVKGDWVWEMFALKNPTYLAYFSSLDFFAEKPWRVKTFTFCWMCESFCFCSERLSSSGRGTCRKYWY